MKTTNHKPTVNTTRYEYAHRGSPRGVGYWAFHPNFDVRGDDPEIFWHNGTYSEAKKAARNHFAGKASEICVLS